jgi:hypothetical protein
MLDKSVSKSASRRRKKPFTRVFTFFLLLPYVFLLVFTLKVTIELGYASLYRAFGNDYLATVVGYDVVPCRDARLFNSDDNKYCTMPEVVYVSEDGSEKRLKAFSGFNSYFDNKNYPIGDEVKIVVVPVSSGEDILNHYSELQGIIEINLAWLIFFLLIHIYVIYRLKKKNVKIEVLSIAGELTRRINGG